MLDDGSCSPGSPDVSDVSPPNTSSSQSSQYKFPSDTLLLSHHEHEVDDTCCQEPEVDDACACDGACDGARDGACDIIDCASDIMDSASDTIDHASDSIDSASEGGAAVEATVATDGACGSQSSHPPIAYSGVD